ncbi:MAG: protein-L-isoaspartate O-methyltransferase [Methanomassiliicoccales archaeon]|jgi:protein-L-isoaspartate(D-aspartate) O-methyltransferase|nr:protein-L-isoaspartate O-methyltransferase [Methanomassiliicoccales archaeon]
MDFDVERKRMIRSLIEKGYLTKPDVIKAMEKVPRHLFVPEGIRRSAYIDTPLSIGEGQTISAPHMVALMVETLDLHPGMKVLEVGGGSGYHAAVMGELVRPDGHVYSVERIESLAERAKRNLKEAGYDDIVTIVVGDGSKGLKEYAPFDRICVAAAAPGVPEPLKQQLADDGKLLVPVGGRWYQDLILVERKQNKYLQMNLGGCVFVPLIGEYGYGD